MESVLISPILYKHECDAARDNMLDIGCLQLGPPAYALGFRDIATFASGKRANNKVIADLPLAEYDDYANVVPEGRRVTPAELNRVRLNIEEQYDAMFQVYEGKVDTLWGVPSGGQSYAKRRAERLVLAFVELVKATNKPGRKSYQPKTPDDARLLKEAHLMVGSEDAGSEGTSLHGALYESDASGLAALRRKTVGIDFVWVRGGLERLQHLGKENAPARMQTIVHELLPNRLTRLHGAYRRFGHLAVPHRALS